MRTLIHISHTGEAVRLPGRSAERERRGAEREDKEARSQGRRSAEREEEEGRSAERVGG